MEKILLVILHQYIFCAILMYLFNCTWVQSYTNICVHSGLISPLDECAIEDNFDSPYITAFYDHPAPIAGCVSNETTAKQQEVHVISLGDGWVHGDDDVASVTLRLRPRKATGMLNPTLPFISFQICSNR